MKYTRKSFSDQNNPEEQDGTNEGIRINKYLSEAGFCSRREADRLVGEGKILIDGRLAVMGEKVLPQSRIEVDGHLVVLEDELVYIAYNKPAGVVCTTDQSVYRNIVDAIGHPKRIFPVGRLDKMSTGLILLTNDGEIVNKILRAGNYHEKEYVVTVDKPFDERFIEQMSTGIPLLNTITRKCTVKKEIETRFRIILTQGLNRQIRRMCEYLGYEVVSLERVRIMNIYIGKLQPGKWRNLTPGELSQLHKLVKDSKKTAAGFEDKAAADSDGGFNE
ncbi:MAG: 23S rRNA pseudouridine(2604) synthase RluF [Saccharofermentanales bacterium]